MMRAAVLMFHPDPERFVAGATVKIAYYAPEGAYGANKSDDIIYQDEVHGPLMLQADKVVDLVYTKYLKALTSYEGLQRVETFMAPREAFREIILNAINHKLYESGNPIQVSVYDDRIVDARIAMQVTGKSSSTVNRYLQRLVGMGVLRPVGGSKNSAYRRI